MNPSTGAVAAPTSAGSDPKMKKTLALALALTLALAAAASAAEPVTLAFKAPEKPLRYTLSSDAKSVFSLYGLDKTIVQLSETVFTCAKGEGEGVPLRLEVLEQALTNDGHPVAETEKGAKVDLSLSPEGEILKSSDVTVLQNFQDMIISMPKHPVKPGDTWVNAVPMQLPDGQGGVIDAQAKIECKLTDLKKFCAFIDTRLVIAPPKNERNEMKALATGKLIFDPARGVIVGHKNDLALKLDVYNVIQEKKVLFTSLDLKMVVTLKLVE